jgi:hypothetical protein
LYSYAQFFLSKEITEKLLLKTVKKKICWLYPVLTEPQDCALRCLTTTATGAAASAATSCSTASDYSSTRHVTTRCCTATARLVAAASLVTASCRTTTGLVSTTTALVSTTTALITLLLLVVHS